MAGVGVQAGWALQAGAAASGGRRAMRKARACCVGGSFALAPLRPRALLARGGRYVRCGAQTRAGGGQRLEGEGTDDSGIPPSAGWVDEPPRYDGGSKGFRRLGLKGLGYSEDYLIDAPLGPYSDSGGDAPPAPGVPGGRFVPDVQDVREAVRVAPGGRPMGRRKQSGGNFVTVASLAVAGGLCYVALKMGDGGVRELPMPTATVTATTVDLQEVPEQLLGHYLYAARSSDEAPAWDLVSVENKGFSTSIRSSAARSFRAMCDAARADGITLVPVSGFRSVKDQEELYYGISSERNQSVMDRAKVSAPPGYSEHHTGYALDISSLPFHGLNEDFENTRAFRWLERNANRYHFEMSFPKGNTQKVMYEPWHWRFVGDIHATQTFYRARGR